MSGQSAPPTTESAHIPWMPLGIKSREAKRRGKVVPQEVVFESAFDRALACSEHGLVASHLAPRGRQCTIVKLAIVVLCAVHSQAITVAVTSGIRTQSAETVRT